MVPSTEIVLGSTGMVRLPPVAGGAVESYVCDLARMARSLDYRVTLVSSLRDKHAVAYDHVVRVASPFDRFPLPAPASSLAHLLGGGSTGLSIASYLKSLPSHTDTIVHMNEEISASIVSKVRRDIPKVFTLHNPPPEVGAPTSGILESTLRRTGNLIAMRFVARSFDGIIALNSVLKDYLIREWDIPKERVFCLPLPIDTDLYAPPPEDKIRKGVLFVGRFDTRKNVLLLLKAFRLIDERIGLTLVGDGPLKNEISAYIRANGFQDRVSVRSRVSIEELIRAYQESSVFAFPSDLEAYPRAVVEAASCGLPVVMADLPINQDFIDHGFVRTYNRGNTRELASCIESVHFDAAGKTKMGYLARQHILNNNGFSAFSNRLSSIYKVLAR